MTIDHKTLEMWKRLDEFDPAQDAVLLMGYIHFAVLHQPDCLPCGAVARVDRWPVPRISRALDYLLDFGILEFSVITELVLKVLTERRAYLQD